MLTDLIIKNFAIIEQLHVEFDAGFNVLTGETGAGKSIIIDAVNLLLGGRARGEVIRTGADEATVEAVFDISGRDEFAARLEEAGLSADGEFVVRRVVARSGKNRTLINGSNVTLTQLRSLTSGLVHIYGQNEHQYLQRPETHLAMLDGFAELGSELERYRNAFDTWIEVRRQLDKQDLAERERHQRLDMLSFHRRELEDARLTAGEDEELERERSLLIHGEKLMAATQGGYEVLYSGANAVCEQLALTADRLEPLGAIDDRLGKLAETLRSHLYGIEDVAGELQSYAEQLDFEPQRQQQVEDRLAQLTALKRKYAPDLNALISYLQEISEEIEQLSDFEQHRDELKRRLDENRGELLSVAADLSRARQAAATSLSQQVDSELADLAMDKAHFSVVFNRLEEPGAGGLETAEFYLAANPGEAAQPLARIASGGELSRIMLALKRSAPEADGVGTLIFDEVDAGIGGQAATAVGEKIGRLGQGAQVLCVTHLPQVAAFADHHYQVAKDQQEDRTATRLSCLDEEQRVAELSRMLGGSHAGQQAVDHARELIRRSKLS